LKKAVEDLNVFIQHFSRIITRIKCENERRGFLVRWCRSHDPFQISLTSFFGGEVHAKNELRKVLKIFASSLW